MSVTPGRIIRTPRCGILTLSVVIGSRRRKEEEVKERRKK